MCDRRENKSESGSSFIFGIFLGAIIGAIVAIYIYKNNRSDVFVDLKNKLQKYFSRFTNDSSSHQKKSKSPTKIIVSIPKSVESINLNPPHKTAPKKMFVKK